MATNNNTYDFTQPSSTGGNNFNYSFISTNTYLNYLSESINSNTSLNSKNELLEVIQEYINNSDENVSIMQILQAVVESLKLSLNCNLISTNVFIQTVSELLQINSTVKVQQEINQAVTELITFVMTSSVFSSSDILVVVNELLLLKDSIVATYDITQVILVILNEILKNKTTLYNFGEFTNYIIDEIHAKDKNNVFSDFVVALNENLKFSTSIISNQSMTVFIEELLNTNFILQLNGFLYECYCVNLDNNALTMYDNFEFDSFCQFQRQYYGIGPNGIYTLDGKTDDGEEIQSLIRTGYFNIANVENKSQGLSAIRLRNDRLQAGYVIIKNNGEITFRIYNDKKEQFDYTLNEMYDNEKFRFQIGSGLKGSMFQLELETEGNFELKDCVILPIILDRKV